MKCGDRIKTTAETESILRGYKIIPIGSTGKIIRKGGSVNLCQYGIKLDDGDIIHMNEDEIEMLDRSIGNDDLINTNDAQERKTS